MFAFFSWFVKLIIYAIISYAISYLMQDDGPKIPGAKPGSFKAPVVTASDSIGILFGRALMQAPNVVWYGDVNTCPYSR